MSINKMRQRKREMAHGTLYNRIIYPLFLTYRGCQLLHWGSIQKHFGSGYMKWRDVMFPYSFWLGTYRESDEDGYWLDDPSWLSQETLDSLIANISQPWLYFHDHYGVVYFRCEKDATLFKLLYPYPTTRVTKT